VLSTAITVTGGLTLANGGQVQVGDASHTGEIDLQGDETVSGTGTITFVGPGGTVKTQANVTLGPGITVHGTSGSLDLISGSLTNQGTIGITVSGHGFVGSTASGAVTMNGTIAADDGGTVKVEGATNFANGTLTGGTWKASSNSTLRILDAQISTNSASILLSGYGSHLYSDAATTDALSALSANAAGGQLTLIGGASVMDSSSLSNSGTVTLGPNRSLTVAAYSQNGGSTSRQGGTLMTTRAAGVDIQAGSFSGPGSVQGNGRNAAAVDLGTDPGILSVTGNFTQTVGGTLSVKLGGTAPGSQYHQVNVTGSASLDGTRVDDLNDYNAVRKNLGKRLP
jgi:hypothetical protein